MVLAPPVDADVPGPQPRSATDPGPAWAWSSPVAMTPGYPGTGSITRPVTNGHADHGGPV